MHHTAHDLRRMALKLPLWRAARAPLLALPALFGACTSSELSERAAHDTFDAVNLVSDELISSTVRSVEGSSAVFTVDAEVQDDLQIEGVLEGGAGWSGTVTLVGAVRTWNDPVSYELLVGFDGVSPTDPALDVVLDGELTLAFVLDYDLELAAAEATLALDGDLAVSGAREGIAAVDYDLSLAVSPLDVSFTASGDISGHDVSGWPFGLSLPL